MRVVSLNQDRGIRPGGRKGAAVHLACLREALLAEGHDVFAVDEPDRGRATARLAELHGEAALDLIVERYALGGVSGARFARQHGVPLALEVNAPLLHEARAHRGLTETADLEDREREVYAAATRIVCVSTEVAESVHARGVDPRVVVVRPNAVDTTVFRPAPRAEPGPLVLGFHGRLRPWHGFERLVEVVRELLQRGLDVRLEIVGEGDFAPALASLPAERVSCHGWQPHPQLARFVSRFDVVLLSYDPDAPCYFSPLKLLESMAVGAVPVVPDLGDLSRAVSHGVDGLVYPARDLSAAVEAVESLAADDELRLTLAEAAVATAARHSWRGLAREIVSWARLGATP